LAKTSEAAGIAHAQTRLAGFSSSAYQNEDKILLLLTLIIGAVVGLVVVAFILLTENLGSRLYPAGGAAWRRLVIPIAGALLTAYPLARYFPNARGSGIPQTKTALFLRDGFIAFRTALGKFGLCSVSLASGIALGREGPAVQVGAGIASVLGRRLGLSTSSVKALVPIGASAALAAAFNTPIAAVLFSLEEVMGDMHAPVLGSIVLSSATSWIVLHLLLGDEPLFHVPSYQLVHPIEFLWYGVLGIAGGLVSVAFVKLLLWQRKHFLKMPRRTLWMQPAVGGAVVGIMGWFVPPVLGVGYLYVGQALNGQMLVGTMALLVCLKIVATASCYASGNAGGIFGPSLYMGAMVGGAVGGFAHMLMPDYTGNAGAYALVGMGAAFAGIVRVPLTSVIMIFEMTRDYSIIVPLMIANLVSYFISSRLQEEPIYEALLHQDGIHLPLGARARAALLTVGHAVQAATPALSATEQISQAWAAASADVSRGAWPVVDTNGLRGMVSMQQLEDALAANRSDEPLGVLVPDPGPSDHLTVENFPHVHADHTLDEALRRLSRGDVKVLPVVSRTNVRELKGTVSLEDVLGAYRIGGAAVEPVSAAGPATRTRRIRPLEATLAALILATVLVAFLNYFYRQGRIERAREYQVAGEQLMKQGRYEDAIAQLRQALSISPNLENRLSLGLALVKAEHGEEGSVYLNEVLRQSPNSGPAHLALAEVAVQQGRIDDAVAQYRRAIDGIWPSNAAQSRLDARIELVKALAQAGRRVQAQTELLALAAEVPPEPGAQKQIAGMLQDLGLPSQAASLYRDVIRRNPRDAAAFDGLGEAELAQANFSAARKAFEAAQQINPNDETAVKRIMLCDQILALDPAVGGLGATERYQRSRDLLAAVVSQTTSCQPPPAILSAAQASLANHRRPRSFSDATESNLAIASELWKDLLPNCSPKPDPDAPVTRLMTQLSRSR
jgi:chloride channel protein, CIC family